jgi:hypothetical protein
VALNSGSSLRGWAGGDAALDDALTHGSIRSSIRGSQWGQYEYVTNIGFAA